MQSVSSSAYHKLSKNSLYSAVRIPPACYYPGGMKSVQSQAYHRLSNSLSSRGLLLSAFGVKSKKAPGVSPAPWHSTETTDKWDQGTAFQTMESLL